MESPGHGSNGLMPKPPMLITGSVGCVWLPPVVVFEVVEEDDEELEEDD